MFATIHISFLIHCSPQSHMALTSHTLLLLANPTVTYMPLKAITHLHYAWAPAAFVFVAHCALPYPNFLSPFLPLYLLLGLLFSLSSLTKPLNIKHSTGHVWGLPSFCHFDIKRLYLDVLWYSTYLKANISKTELMLLPTAWYSSLVLR